MEDFDAGNRLPKNVNDDHTFIIDCQSCITVTRTEAAFWLGLRVKRGTEAVLAAAPIKNLQSRHLCRRFGFALVFERAGSGA